MNPARIILRMAGWSVHCSVPDYPKCIICVAPHTSNWDFIVGKLAYASLGRKAGFLMKQSWFFWPLGCLWRAIGGVPVPRGKQRGGSLIALLTERFRQSRRLTLAITPEGTRSRTSAWHTGFLRIAHEAQVPVVLGVLDFENRKVLLERTFTPGESIEADLRAIKDYYRSFKGLYPEKFTAE